MAKPKKIILCTVHFNTPDLMDALIKSIEMHVPNYHLYIFDNSDIEPYNTDNEHVTIIDNTKGQIINFDEFLERYPNRFKYGGKGNGWASAKHCYTIQKCIDMIKKPFILLDSDVLLKKDISELYDPTCVAVGTLRTFHIKKHRVLPFVCFINPKKMKELNISYFDERRMLGLNFDDNTDYYDTGASFYEDIKDTGLFKNIDFSDYILHYGSGSWECKSRESKGHTTCSSKQWLDQNKMYWKKSSTKVVYTCITGNYDNLKNINIEEGWDYVCFTDTNIESDVWDIRPIPSMINNLSRVKQQRFIKMNPHKVLPEYEESIWIDGNLLLTGSLTDLYNDVIDDSHSVYFKKHLDRICIFQELDACIKYKKENADVINRLRKYYTDCGFPKGYGLYETNIIIRKHNDPDCIRLMDAWTIEMLKGSHRDQLSLNFCIWQLGLKDKIKEIDYQKVNDVIKITPHNKPANTQQRVVQKPKVEPVNKAKLIIKPELKPELKPKSINEPKRSSIRRSIKI